MTGRRPRPVTRRRHSDPISRTTTFQTNPRNQIFLPFPPFLYPSNSFPTFRPRIVKYLKSISAHFCVHQIGQDLTPSLHKKVLVHICKRVFAHQPSDLLSAFERVCISLLYFIHNDNCLVKSLRNLLNYLKCSWPYIILLLKKKSATNFCVQAVIFLTGIQCTCAVYFYMEYCQQACNICPFFLPIIPYLPKTSFPVFLPLSCVKKRFK